MCRDRRPGVRSRSWLASASGRSWIKAEPRRTTNPAGKSVASGRFQAVFAPEATNPAGPRRRDESAAGGEVAWNQGFGGPGTALGPAGRICRVSCRTPGNGRRRLPPPPRGCRRLAGQAGEARLFVAQPRGWERRRLAGAPRAKPASSLPSQHSPLRGGGKLRFPQSRQDAGAPSRVATPRRGGKLRFPQSRQDAGAQPRGCATKRSLGQGLRPFYLSSAQSSSKADRAVESFAVG